MLLKSHKIAERLNPKTTTDDPFVIVPKPDHDELAKTGSAAIDLRLGTWFLTMKQSKISLLDVAVDPGKKEIDEEHFTRSYYIPFGSKFVLHPGNFALGVTLEWLRFSKDLAGYVIGKSSWGRRGLIIATAAGVHPGFTGCLTLELSNIGEIPIEIRPGMPICQLFIHEVEISSDVDKSKFVGHRKPKVGTIELDNVAKKLAADLYKNQIELQIE